MKIRDTTASSSIRVQPLASETPRPRRGSHPCIGAVVHSWVGGLAFMIPLPCILAFLHWCISAFLLHQCKNARMRSEEHTSELQSHLNLVCRLLLEKKKRMARTR